MHALLITGQVFGKMKITEIKKSYLKDFETISSKSKFNKIISKDASFTFKLPKQIINNGWEDIFYNETNNFANFKYDNQNQLLLKK